MRYSLTWRIGLILCSNFLSAVTYATADEPDFYAVTRIIGTDSLALHKAATLNSPILSTIPFNAVKVKNKGERKNNWCQVQYKQQVGWAACKYLTESDGKAYYATHGYTDKLNIRRMPHNNASIVGTIPHEETGIQRTGECNKQWCPINYQGKQGWVARRYLSSWSF